MKMAESIFKSLCLLVMTENCFDEFFINFNFFHVLCLKALISKGLGIAIVAGSVFVKVPQILKILKAKSAEGISFLGSSLEIFALLSSVSYNFNNGYPFSAYGDGCFLLLQTTIIASLVLSFSGSPQQSVPFAIAVSIVTAILCSGFVPLSMLWNLQASNIPIVISAKLIQAYTNYCNGNTGQLSALMLTMLFLGSSARIFTSIQETGDFVLIATYSASTLANFILLAQLGWYWNVKPKSKSRKSKKQ